MTVKRIGPLSFAKIAGVLYAVVGLIAGCLFALFSTVGGLVSQQSAGPIFGLVFGVGAIVFLPVLYGGIGFVMSLLMAALYNLVAEWVGGIEIEIAQGSAGVGSGHGA